MDPQATQIAETARVIQQRRIYELWYGDLYRVEREQYPEWIDLGGEGGEA